MLRDEKGVRFVHMSEADAEEYLIHKNNYLRAASYRKNYAKHKVGPNIGKYINLDFAYMKELSSLDMHFRAHLLPMCIDIEHALKVQTVLAVEANPAEDGYSICDEFLQANPYILHRIEEKADSIFTGELIEKYFNLCYVFDTSHTPVSSVRTRIHACDCPVWVLVEIIGFNSLIKFAQFYNQKYPNTIDIDLKILNPVRSLRNACAHNNCLLNNLRPQSTRPPQTISKFITGIPSVGKEERKNKLSCRPLFEFACLMYLFETVVSDSVRDRRMAELKKFVDNRLFAHADYFTDNQVISTSLNFIKKVVDNSQ